MLKEKFQKIWITKITGQQVYIFSLVLYLFFAFLQNSTFHAYLGSRPFNLVSYLVVGLLILKIIFLDDYSSIQRGIIFLILILAMISWLKSKSNLIIVMMVFILSGQGVSFREVVKYYYNVTLIIFAVVVTSSLLGVIKNLIFVVKGRAIRYSLGIVYPTDLAARVLYLLLAHAFLNFERLNWKYYFSYFLIDVVLMKITNARLSVLCILIMIGVLIIAKRASNHPDGISRLFVSMYWMAAPILSFLAIIATYFYDGENHIYTKINHLLSGRLSYGSLAFYNYKIPLLGQKVIEHGLGGNSGLRIFHHSNQGYFFIDSSYMRLLMIYGLLMLLIVIGIIMTISIKAILNKNFVLPTVMLIVVISCMVEQHLLELSYNPFLLALLTSCKPINHRVKGKFNNE